MSQMDILKFQLPENPAPGTAKLRPYQEEALNKIIQDYRSNKSRRQLIVLATGLGKSIQMGAIANWCLKELKKPVLMLAHREELLEQASNEFKLSIGPDYEIQIEQAERHADTTAHIVLASVQSIGREENNRILKFHRDHFGLVCIDECHHATSDTYKNIINYFCSNPDTLLVGVTATPNRSDKESLSDIFDSVAINLDIVKGTKDGYLCPIVSWRIGSQTDLSNIRTTAGDFNLKDLDAAVNNKARNTLIVEAYAKRFPDKQALVFATSVEHAEQLREEFHSIGVSAESVSAKTPKEERRQIFSDFKSGKLKILTNNLIATEGFNYPALDLIIQARPTQSPLLCCQIAGRNTRLFEGKKVAHVIEIIDNHSEKTTTVAKIFNFKQQFDCEGHDFLECLNKANEMVLNKEWFNPYNCNSWSEMLSGYERSSRENPKGLNLPPEILERLRKEKENQNIYSEFNPSNEYFDRNYRWLYSGQSLKLLHSDKDEGYRYQMIAIPNPLGGFDITMARKPMNASREERAERLISYRGANAPDAIAKMEDYILKNFPDWHRLLAINAPWKKRAQTEPATEKQLAIIIKNRLSTKPKDQITKFEAGELLNKFFSRFN